MTSRLTNILGSKFSVVRILESCMRLPLLDISQVMINPFAPLFAENRVLKLVELFSGQFWTIKSQRCPNVVSRSSNWQPSTADAKYKLLKFGHAQNAKSHDTEVSTFTFRFVSFVFGTVFRTLGFDGRKHRCVVE